jgi:hypothetical protein
MKVNRNEPCTCGSGKKYKNCCGQKRFSRSDGVSKFQLFIISGILVLTAITVYGIVEFYQTDRPEMEAYQCDNPNCGKIHYRPVTN